MFTGIIREVGEVLSLNRSDEGARIRLGAGLATELNEGDSVAVAGACLTVAAHDSESFEADVMNQTLALTTLGALAPGGRVNLEPAIEAGTPLGGHLVQGHVDAVAEVAGVSEDGIARRVQIEAPDELRRYVAEHGSVALDGVSLTVASVDDQGFEVSLIPETLERTTLGSLKAGSRLNLEVDLVARYVERLVGFGEAR